MPPEKISETSNAKIWQIRLQVNITDMTFFAAIINLQEVGIFFSFIFIEDFPSFVNFSAVLIAIMIYAGMSTTV